MNHVIRHLEYLTLRHDCVVLKGWGAFIARPVSAYYDESASRFVPPCRELSFNGEIVHDDGLLASSIARKESISYERARVIVDRELAAMSEQLLREGELPLGLLGRFVQQAGSTPIYEPSTRLEGLMYRFNRPLHLQTLTQKVKEAAGIDAAVGKRRSRLKTLGLRVSRIAASLLVVAAVGYGLLAPVVTGREDKMAAVSATATGLTPSVQTSLMPVSAAGNLTLNIAAPAHRAVDNVAVVSNVESTVGEIKSTAVALHEGDNSETITTPVKSENQIGSLRLVDGDPYCLVVASLPTRKGAEQFVKETPGFEYKILEQEGKYRVYVASGKSNSQALAQKELAGIAGKFPEAWVCRRL